MMKKTGMKNRRRIIGGEQRKRNRSMIGEVDTTDLEVVERLKKLVEETEPVPRGHQALMFPRQFTVDRGGEWKGDFERGCRSRGGTVHVSVPQRSTSNAVAKRWIQECGLGGASLLTQAGAPDCLWSYAIEFFEY